MLFSLPEMLSTFLSAYGNPPHCFQTTQGEFPCRAFPDAPFGVHTLPPARPNPSLLRSVVLHVAVWSQECGGPVVAGAEVTGRKPQEAQGTTPCHFAVTAL